MTSIPAPVVEYVMHLEDALYTLRRMYKNPALRAIVNDALANRELFLNLVDVEIEIPQIDPTQPMQPLQLEPPTDEI